MKQGSNGNYSPIGSLLKLIVMDRSSKPFKKIKNQVCLLLPGVGVDIATAQPIISFGCPAGKNMK
jgi:hypothetical protein